VHIHLIPRAPDLARELYGPHVFGLMRAAFATGRSNGDPAWARTPALAVKARLAEGA
jgi:hypothetical protein